MWGSVVLYISTSNFGYTTGSSTVLYSASVGSAIVVTVKVYARWFTSRVDGRDLEVLERVDCAVVTQQATLIFPSN